MKRYLLFIGHDYYPCGGWDDFVGDFDSAEQAKVSIEYGDWWHIIDTADQSRVGEGQCRELPTWKPNRTYLTTLDR